MQVVPFGGGACLPYYRGPGHLAWRLAQLLRSMQTRTYLATTNCAPPSPPSASLISFAPRCAPPGRIPSLVGPPPPPSVRRRDRLLAAPFPGAMATQITLRSAEGDNFEVDEAVAFESQMIKNMIEGAWKKRTHNSALGGGVCECKSFLEALRPALPR